MIKLLIFDFVLKSGQVQNLATNAGEDDATVRAAEIVDNLFELQAISGFDPRTQCHWRVLVEEIALIKAYAGQIPS